MVRGFIVITSCTFVHVLDRLFVLFVLVSFVFQFNDQ